MVVGLETHQRRKYLYPQCTLAVVTEWRLVRPHPCPSLPPFLPLPPADRLPFSPACMFFGSRGFIFSSRPISISHHLSLNGSHGFSTTLKLLTRNMSWGKRTESHQQDTSKNTTSGARHASVPLDFLTKENRTEASRREASRTTGLREVYHDFIRQGQGEHEHDTPP